MLKSQPTSLGSLRQQRSLTQGKAGLCGGSAWGTPRSGVTPDLSTAPTPQPRTFRCGAARGSPARPRTAHPSPADPESLEPRSCLQKNPQLKNQSSPTSPKDRPEQSRLFVPFALPSLGFLGLFVVSFFFNVQMLSWAAVCMRRAASLFAVLLVTEKELEDRVVSCRAGCEQKGRSWGSEMRCCEMRCCAPVQLTPLQFLWRMPMALWLSWVCPS